MGFGSSSCADAVCYPLLPLTTSTTTTTTSAVSRCCSSTASSTSYLVFDRLANTSATFSSGQYNASVCTALYYGGSFAGTPGYWIMVKLHEGMLLCQVRMYAATSSTRAQAPGRFQIYGTNAALQFDAPMWDANGVSSRQWTLVHDRMLSALLLPDDYVDKVYTVDVSPTNLAPFSTYVMVVTQLAGSGASALALAELELYGIPCPAGTRWSGSTGSCVQCMANTVFQSAAVEACEACAATSWKQYTVSSSSTTGVGVCVSMTKFPRTLLNSSYTAKAKVSTLYQGNQNYAWGAYDRVLNSKVGFHTESSQYSLATSTYALNNLSFAGYPGDWGMIDLGESMVLLSFKIYPRTDAGLESRSPGRFQIYGTNNASEFTSPTWSLAQWTLVYDQTERVTTYMWLGRSFSLPSNH